MPDQSPVADPALLRDRLLAWYDVHARDLPWREPSASPWAVMVSEFMLQQTPVARVLPVYEQWLTAWPTPADLAATSPGDAVRAWGRLGYPRRALRLHAAATAIVEQHGGTVPSDYADLVALPGIGDYTAAAIASFAFRRRHVVLDTNVRRVLTRTRRGVEFPATAVTRAERDLATGLLPDDGPTAAAWAVATMELGATVCVAASPRCDDCPVADLCAWRAAGYPAYDGPARRGQAYDGTDRQCRGRLLGVLRDSDGPVHRSRLEAVWAVDEQRDRCLQWLVDDGLVARVDDADLCAALSGPGDHDDRIGEVLDRLVQHRVAGVERQVELEAHEGGVEQGGGAAGPLPRHPGAREMVGDRRDPQGVGLAHHRDVGLVPEQPERGGLDVHPLAARQPG